MSEGIVTFLRGGADACRTVAEDMGAPEGCEQSSIGSRSLRGAKWASQRERGNDVIGRMNEMRESRCARAIDRRAIHRAACACADRKKAAKPHEFHGIGPQDQRGVRGAARGGASATP